MQLPSKELLSAVLTIDNIHGDMEIHGNVLHYDVELFDFEDTAYSSYEINIDEFMGKCKEFSYTNLFIIQTKIVHKSKWRYLAEIHYIVEDKEMTSSYFFRGNSEPEAVFKATEWALEEVANAIT